MSWLRLLVPWRRRHHNGAHARRDEERKLAASRRRWAETHAASDQLAVWIDEALRGNKP